MYRNSYERTFDMKNGLLFFLASFFGIAAFAQDDIKIMSYNILNYPTGGNIVNRIDTFSKILDYYEPDLLLLQELKSEQGLDDIEQELNNLFGNYRAGTYVAQVSNPSNSWRLQQNIVYNESVFKLVGEQVITTTYRDINYFQLRILNQDGTPSPDILHTYVTHLKSSQGSSNQQLRLEMANVLFDHIATLPEKSNIVVGGDFNVYNSQEPAYQKLLSDNGTNSLQDPIDMPFWADSNFQNREILTQSTRSSSLSDGAGGGMDDRFDFVLLSDQLMTQDTRLDYQLDSYLALGNNGTCYNQDLIDCSTVDNVSYEMLRALYYMSDHLPVVLSLNRNPSVSTNNVLSPSAMLEIRPNPANTEIELILNDNIPVDIRFFNAVGTMIFERRSLNQNASFSVAEFPQGMYVLQVRDRISGAMSFSKVIIQR